MQFFGWMVGANTMLEYLLAGSTVAKGFASYFTTMIGAACCKQTACICFIQFKLHHASTAVNSRA
jgi:hypothetical protein